MTKENLECCFKRDSNGKIIFVPINESRVNDYYLQCKETMSSLKDGIVSREDIIDSLFSKGKEAKETRNRLKLELHFYKKELELENEKFYSIKEWCLNNNIPEPDSLREKLEKQQQKKRIDKYIKMVHQKVKKEMEPAKGEKIEAESKLTITKKGCLDLCEKLLNSEYKMTDEEEKISKHKTFSKWRNHFMRDSKNDMYKNFPIIMSELEKQKFISYDEFAKIVNVPSPYYNQVLLNSFIQSCNL